MPTTKELVEHLQKCKTLPAWEKVPPKLKMKVNSCLLQSKRFLPKDEK